MKTAGGYLFIALLLLASGALLGRTGELERRAVSARLQLATLQYAAPEHEYREVENESRYLRHLPWISSLDTGVNAQKAISQYWQSDYPALELQRDASGVVTEQDPELLLLNANAGYRATKLVPGDPGVDRQLLSVQSSYAEVLKKDPDNVDAAYNYEFLARLRENMAAVHAAKAGAKEQGVAAKVRMTPGRTVEGEQGAPPQGTDMTQFKVLIPKQGDERKDDPEAGKGTKRVRKG